MTTESAALEKLQQRLGYTFGDRGVLLQSMTHTSFGHENLQTKSIALRDNPEKREPKPAAS